MADADADADASIDAAMEAMIESDARASALASAQVDGIWDDIKATVAGWGEDIQKGWEQLKKNARGINLTTMSKFLSRTMSGMTVFQSFAHDYMDHVATSENPMSIYDFFYQTMFYHGMGDWDTFNQIQKNLGEEPEKDGYIAQRKDSRNEVVFEKLEQLKKDIDSVVNELPKDKNAKKKAKEFTTYQTHKLPQAFYDAVGEYRDAKIVSGAAKTAEIAKKAESDKAGSKKGQKK